MDIGQLNYETLLIFNIFCFKSIQIFGLLHIKYQIQILLVAKEKVCLTTLAMAGIFKRDVASPLKNNSITLPLFGLIIYPTFTQNVP